MRKLVIVAGLSLLLTGCSITPQPFTLEEIANSAEDKKARVTANQEPIRGPISLYQAMARALKYNLDYRVEIMEQIVANKDLHLTRFDMLPQVVSSTGWDNYNRYRYSTSVRNDGSPPSDGYSRSNDKNHFVHDLTFSWSILDFGLSRIRAHQSADKVLIAEERKRKVVNRVIEDVRTAFWRAVSADKLVWQLRKLEGEVQKALKNSRNIEKDGETSPLTALTYQRELIEIKKKIEDLLDELKDAKIQLAALMNLKPGTKYRLSTKNYHRPRLKLKYSARTMVDLALRNRPELREVGYRRRINADEAEAALLEALPGIKLYAGANFDANDLLLHKNWISWGAKVGWNLMKVFKYPEAVEAVEMKDRALDERALALTMAIMTQVHVSRLRYAFARKKIRSSDSYLRVQRKILSQIQAEFNAGKVSEQTLIREKMNTMVARVKHDIAYAELQNAFANVFASMGLPPYSVEVMGDESVKTLARSLSRLWRKRGERVASR